MRLNKDTVYVEGGHQRANFLIGIPSLGTCSIKFAMSLSRLQMPLNSEVHSVVVERMEIADARNYIVNHLLSLNPMPKYLFFLGDDMLPQWDALVRLHEEMIKGNWDLLTGLYYLKQDPPEPLLRRKHISGSLIPGKHFDVGDVVSVDLTGLDFTLIKSSVFAKLKYPYFRTGFTQHNKKYGKPKIIMHTEDVHLMDQMLKQKMSIGVHTGIRVGHFDYKSGQVF